LAVHDQRDRLTYAGHVGTGFTDLALRRLQHDLDLLARSTPAVPDAPHEHARHVHRVEQVLVGEVAFRTGHPTTACGIPRGEACEPIARRRRYGAFPCRLPHRHAAP
jgi:ATP-dependent DNA ligase